MTWLSRLLPQSTRFQPRNDRRRSMTTKQRRRISTLEMLETRVVLNGSVVATGGANNALLITADKLANTFTIEEFHQDGATHVKIYSGDTLINGGNYWETSGAVTSITVNLPTNLNGAFDNITLIGEGKGVGETTKNVTFNVNSTNLNLDVADINNGSGAFKLTSHGTLNVGMDASVWNSVSILQDGCCPAHVDISDTNVSGSVTVKEGWGNGDSITVSDSTFGATVLAQYYNAKPSTGKNCDGNGDTITVTDSTVRTLDVYQGAPLSTPKTGNDNTIRIDGLLVGSGTNDFGVRTSQGDGDRAHTFVNDVNLVAPPNPNARVAPKAGIEVVQGCGVDDVAWITDSTVPGDVTIVQGCGEPCDDVLTASGANANALIAGVDAGLPKSYYYGEISITQGDGKNSNALITDSTTAELSIWISQGDGELDDATISNIAHAGGSIYIEQGAAYTIGDDKVAHGGDHATIVAVTAEEDIYITQCDAAGQGDNFATATIEDATTVESGSKETKDYKPGGSITITQAESDGDQALITGATAHGDICIYQGSGDGDTATIEFATTVANGDYFVHDYKNPYYPGGDICIYQGDGDGDTATIQSSTSASDIYITQGDGCNDTANVLGVTAGFIDDTGGFPLDVDGNVSVFQGDGYHDVVNVDTDGAQDNLINNLYITQGDGIPCDDPDVCVPGQSDEVHVNDSIIASDIYISQGYDWVEETSGEDTFLVWEETGEGFYIVTIGDTSPVEAGGSTIIEQAGLGNFLSMNDFTTTWLDVWQGSGGLATATASNTTVFFGSYYGSEFTIDAGTYSDMDGSVPNVFIDGGGNSGVTVSDTYVIVV